MSVHEGPEVEKSYSSTLSLISLLERVGDSRRAVKGLSSNLGVGRGANNSSPLNISKYLYIKRAIKQIVVIKGAKHFANYLQKFIQHHAQC